MPTVGRENQVNITINGGIYFDVGSSGWDDAPRFTFFSGEMRPFGGYQPVVAHTITFTVPEGFSAEHSAIAALERQRKELHSKFAEDVRRINERIANLQALTNEAPQ